MVWITLKIVEKADKNYVEICNFVKSYPQTFVFYAEMWKTFRLCSGCINVKQTNKLTAWFIKINRLVFQVKISNSGRAYSFSFAFRFYGR